MKKKKIYIEVLRIISAMMVLYIHSPFYYSWESSGMPNINRIFYMIPNIVASCAVPIFMMITGSLLLQKDETIREILKKRILKVLRIILFVTILELIRSVIFHREYTIIYFILDFFNFSGRKSILYWFLYWWLSFVILLPFLQKFVKTINHVDFKYLLIIYMTFNMLFPAINIVLKHYFSLQIVLSSSFSLFIISSGIFYPILGYYIDNNIKVEGSKVNKTAPILIIALCILFSILLNFVSMDTNGKIEPSNIFTPVISASIFLLVKILFINSNNDKVNSVLCFFGEQTIGVYLLQVVMPDIVIILKSLFPAGINMVLAKFIVFIFNFFFCCFITAILRRIPILRKILR